MKLNLTLIPNFVVQFHFFESMFTLVSLSNLNLISEPILIPIPIDFEHRPPILDSHISLLGNECEVQFFDMNQTLEPNRTLERKLDFAQFYESALVPVPFIPEPKSTTTLNHIPLLDQGINSYDSMMIFQEWSCKENNFHERILHDPIHIGDCKLKRG